MLCVDCWRKVRKKLPADLRKLLRLRPPADPAVARRMLLDVLREHRRRLAAEAVPVWRVRYAQIAKVVGVDRKTVAKWAADSAGILSERGGVVIDGVTALAMANELGAAVETMEQAIAWLEARHGSMRVELPTEARSGPGDPRFQPFPQLSESDPTVEELSALVYDASPWDKLSKRIERGRHLRAILAEHGQEVPEGGRVSRRWLSSPAGQAFWIDAARRTKPEARQRVALTEPNPLLQAMDASCVSGWEHRLTQEIQTPPKRSRERSALKERMHGAS